MPYFSYWGKAASDDGNAECHLLPYHSLDVAAVGWYLLAPEKALTQQLANQLGLKPAALRQLLVSDPRTRGNEPRRRPVVGRCWASGRRPGG